MIKSARRASSLSRLAASSRNVQKSVSCEGICFDSVISKGIALRTSGTPLVLRRTLCAAKPPSLDVDKQDYPELYEVRHAHPKIRGMQIIKTPSINKVRVCNRQHNPLSTAYRVIQLPQFE